MSARYVFPLVVAVLLTSGWSFRDRIGVASYKDLARRRSTLASRRTTADLQVALVRTSASMSSLAFVRGAMLAAEEINSAGGVALLDQEKREIFSRPLNIRVYDAPFAGSNPSERVNASLTLARRIATDPNVVAVLGHSFDAAIPASAVYNAYELLYLAPSTTEPALTSHRDMPFVFRVCPSDDDIMHAMVKFLPSIVRKKKVHVLLLYPESKARPAGIDPARRLSESAAMLIRHQSVEFVVTGLPYDEDSLDRLFRSKLLFEPDHYNVVLIADLSTFATTVRDGIEEIWTRQLLNVREKEKLFQPRILDLGQLVGYDTEDASSNSFSVPTEGVDLEYASMVYESMVRLILKETKQKVVVLFERESSVAPEGVAGESTLSVPVSSHSGYGKRLSAYLDEEPPLTEDSLDALSRLTVLDVVLTRSYDPQATDFADLAAEVARVPVDYLYLVGFNRSAIELLKQLRRAGVPAPVIGSPRLDEKLEDGDLPELIGETYVAASFDANSRSPQVESFLKSYRAYVRRVGGATAEDRNHEFAGAAAYGYVSVQLLKRAFEGAKTASPRKAAEFARLFVSIDGPLGQNAFKGGRDLHNLPIIFHRLGAPPARPPDRPTTPPPPSVDPTNRRASAPSRP